VPGQDGRCGMAAIVQGGAQTDEIRDESLPITPQLPVDLKALAERMFTTLTLTLTDIHTCVIMPPIGVTLELPPYSRPYFVRLLPEMEFTGTYKFKKVELRDSGYNPNVIRDQLYFLKDGREYVRVTNELYEQIQSGALRF
jgi:acyl-CoA synthetase (AMP-forming)/AMP-acid ligase II